jgi:hypothetical protein
MADMQVDLDRLLKHMKQKKQNRPARFRKLQNRSRALRTVKLSL